VSHFSYAICYSEFIDQEIPTDKVRARGQEARPDFLGATRFRVECDENSEAKTIRKDSKPAFNEEKCITKAD
jgi:hypothetical protein